MRSLFIALLVIFSTYNFSQVSKMNAELRFLAEEKNIENLQLNVLVEGNIDDLLNSQNQNQFKVVYRTQNIASISCSYASLNSLIEKGLFQHAELASAKYRPLNDTMVYRDRIKQVKLWTSPLPQAYNGNGILIGIIDTGIDFSHPDFKDSLGKTRILYIWDQNVTGTVNAPAPFNYGREWTSTQINNNQCTHSDAANYGHGTHVAGIAAGNGLANGTHEGVASKAQLIVVALDFNRIGPTIADAVTYIFNKAQQLNQPCVINASVGDYYGSHDGTDLEAQLINAQLKNYPGRVLVAAAGNAGTDKFHVKTQSSSTDTVFSWIKNNTNLLEYWCYGDTSQFRNLRISIGANRNSFTNLGKTTFRNYKAGLSSVKRDTIFRNAKRIGIVEMAASVNSSGVCEWYYKIKPDSLNTYWRIETTGNGLHHAWNFDFVSSGLPSVAQYPKMTKHLMPDTFYTMVSGFQNSDEVITVGNYVNLSQYKDVNNQTQSLGFIGGRISQSSSNGPTRDGRIKPDIAATGESVFSAIVLSLKALFISNQPYKVALGGYHLLGGGTSAASPVVAGLAALYLQRYPSASNQQVKDAIRFCAYQDDYTGHNLPNSQWGFGKLDGKAVMTCSDVKVFTGLTSQHQNEIQFFPNPVEDQLQINVKANQGSYQLFDSKGDCLYKNNFDTSPLQLDLKSILPNYHGLILMRMETNQEQYTIKFIKE